MPIEKEEIKEEIQEREEWIYTYGDMITLLLIFFIVIFTNINPETEKLKAISASFRSGPPASPYALKGGSSLFEELFESLKSQQAESSTSLNVVENGVKIVMHEGLLFEKNSIAISAKARATIRKFSVLIFTTRNGLVIEGYASKVEGKGKYTQWELSALRAAAVANVVEQAGINAERIEVIGFGINKPKVVSDDLIQLKINQRVDILVKDIAPL